MASAEFDQTIDQLSALEIMDDAEYSLLQDEKTWYKEKAELHIDKAKKWEDNKPEEYEIFFAPYQLKLYRSTQDDGTVVPQLFPSIADALAYAFEHYTDSDIEHVFVLTALDRLHLWGVEFTTYRHPFVRPEEMLAPWIRPYDA